MEDKDVNCVGKMKEGVRVFDGPMFGCTADDEDVNATEISGVFISSNSLLKAKEKDCATELARALFRGVFTDIALRSCSLGGNEARGTGRREMPRPCLCPNATAAIFKYTIKRQKGKWKPPMPLSVIKQSIRSMMSEVRFRQRKLKQKQLLKKKEFKRQH